MVGWWPFSGNANDQSGKGNNGTIYGTTLTTDRFGNLNNAYYFGRNGKYIDLGSAGLSSNPDTCSFSVWTLLDSLYVGSFGQTSVILTKRHVDRAPSWTTIQVDSNSCINVSIDRPSTIDNLPYNKKLSKGQWANIIVLKKRNRYSLYVNGLFYKDTLISYNQVGSTYNMHVGHSGAWNTYYYGKIDDIGIWNRALTPLEIESISKGCFNITTEPINQSSSLNKQVQFNVLASDTTVSYQWQSNPSSVGWINLSSNSVYSGVTTKKLTVSNIKLNNHKQLFRVIATKNTCKDTSLVAILNVNDTCITNVFDTIVTSTTDTLYIKVNTSSLSNPVYNTIKVYPNPSSTQVIIDNGNYSTMGTYTAKIVNALGQQVFQSVINQQQFVIDTNTMGGAGVYTLYIIDANSKVVGVKKIVLQ